MTGSVVIKVITAAGAAAVALPLLIIVLVTASPVPPTVTAAQTGLADATAGLAEAGIPPAWLMWYMDAARTCPGLPWPVLAGIGEAGSDHGRSPLPGVHSGRSSRGAEGPMQVEPATFSAYATGPDRPLSPYDPADAIYTAAAALCAQGARSGSPSGIEQAVFAYNHARWYVTEVMSWAARYVAQGTGQPASTVAATAIAFAKAQLGKPYLWGAAGPDAYDCSGLVYAAYAAAGVRIARTTYQWSRPSAPPLPKPPHPAVAARAVSDAAHVAAYIWARPLDPARHGRAVSQLYSVLRDLGIAARGLARYQITDIPADPVSPDFPRHVDAGARWLLNTCESLDGVLAAEGPGPVPDPDEPGAVLCRAARTAILAWRQPSGTSTDLGITVRRFITATGFLSAATLSLAAYAPRRRAIDLHAVCAGLAEVTAYLTAAIQAPAEDASPRHDTEPAQPAAAGNELPGDEDRQGAGPGGAA